MRVPFHRWTDLRHLAGWRLQGRSDGRHRIQDPAEKIRWRGSADQAPAAFDRLASQHHLAWSCNRFAVTLHGLLHSRHAMIPLSQALQRSLQADGLNFEYATTSAAIEQHARALDRVLSDLPAGRQVDFVAHSLGTIVVRRWFGLLQSGEAESTHLRLGRIVMLAPPNQGSSLAGFLARLPLGPKVLGPAGQQIGPHWKTLQPQLPVPTIPFGIVTVRVPRWMPNPLLLRSEDRPHDWIVRERETWLEGAADHITLPGVHAWMMKQPQVIESVIHFLQHGRFPNHCQRFELATKES